MPDMLRAFIVNDLPTSDQLHCALTCRNLSQSEITKQYNENYINQLIDQAKQNNGEI